MGNSAPPTREERLERALRDIVQHYETLLGMRLCKNLGAYNIAKRALHPAVDGEETKP